ncbi:histidine kinase [uncultured Desulfovibrio sp.]|uniref:histidine kinase n=1 Tax=uncultured Desulfovibrio sp. TaxID=167968 RepID=UPI00260CDD28|nr:histidine kinase [uncultured Desulfovibrio sp.]
MSVPTRQPSVLLLCKSEQAAAVDKRALRDAGATHIRTMTSGLDAARIMAGLEPDKPKLEPDIIVCQHKLDDIDGEQFCALLRLHPRLLGMPILLLLPNDDEEAQLRALGCGASALMGRPFSVDALRKNLEALMAYDRRMAQLDRGKENADQQAFDDALSTYGVLLKPVRTPDDYFYVGMRCLEEKRWNSALSAFQRSLQGAQIRGEALLGMAVAWRGKGDLVRCRRCLEQAALTFALAKRWHNARTVFIRLLREDPQARSPFLTAAQRLMRENRYADAARALAAGIDLTPPQLVGTRVAQICMASGQPQAMFDQLQQHLDGELGQQAGDLTQAIRCRMEDLQKQQIERQKQNAQERQRLIAREMRARARENEAAAASADGPLSEQPVAAPFEAPLETPPQPLSRKDPAAADAPGRQSALPPEEGPEAPAFRGALPAASPSLPPAKPSPYLAPFSEEDASSTLFKRLPIINELCSVIKCTWKLARRKKNERK